MTASPNTNLGIAVEVLTEQNWERYRTLRLESLKTDPAAFGGNTADALLLKEQDWIKKFAQLTPLVASINGQDVAVLTIENFAGDFQTTCWIGGCWVDPAYRGQGVMRAMFDYINQNAKTYNWTVQGLGVWVDNFSAIEVYRALGFTYVGDPQPSTSKPGMFYQCMIRKAPKDAK